MTKRFFFVALVFALSLVYLLGAEIVRKMYSAFADTLKIYHFWVAVAGNEEIRHILNKF